MQPECILLVKNISTFLGVGPRSGIILDSLLLYIFRMVVWWYVLDSFSEWFFWDITVATCCMHTLYYTKNRGEINVQSSMLLVFTTEVWSRCVGLCTMHWYDILGVCIRMHSRWHGICCYVLKSLQAHSTYNGGSERGTPQNWLPEKDSYYIQLS